jgi:glutamyl-tRNA reductase
LYDIDDLKGVIDENLKTRYKDLENAEEIILQGERDFQRWLNGLKAVPSIIALRKRFDEIKAAEIKDALRRFGNSSDREKQIIESIATGIIGTILHNPIVNLKKEALTSLGALYVDTIKKLFELDSEFEFLEEEDNQASIKDCR